MDEEHPITVALVNDYEVVVQGLMQMFRGETRFRIIELEAGGLPDHPVDIALFDTFARPTDTQRLAQLRDLPHVGKVVVYSWDADESQVGNALEAGAAGFVSKTLGADQLMSALDRVHAGATVVETGSAEDPEDAASPADTPTRPVDWLGRKFGLTYREAEVVALIGDGVTNQEIAERLYLSINSVKSHIRSAYRKMEVERRSQAVRWAHENGLARSSVASPE